MIPPCPVWCSTDQPCTGCQARKVMGTPSQPVNPSSWGPSRRVGGRTNPDYYEANRMRAKGSILVKNEVFER